MPGLLRRGLNYFYSMEKTYGIVPREEHYNCIIVLLGWAGRLKEAEAFINGMPVKQNAFGWCSFLGVCNVNDNERSRKSAAEKLIKLELENTRARVMLSNLYAQKGKCAEIAYI